jgi:hypothetical protein
MIGGIGATYPQRNQGTSFLFSFSHGKCTHQEVQIASQCIYFVNELVEDFFSGYAHIFLSHTYPRKTYGNIFVTIDGMFSQ